MLGDGLSSASGCARAPQDIASAIVYLGLDAPYVTGPVLAVDGGGA